MLVCVYNIEKAVLSIHLLHHRQSLRINVNIHVLCKVYALRELQGSQSLALFAPEMGGGTLARFSNLQNSCSKSFQQKPRTSFLMIME